MKSVTNRWARAPLAVACILLVLALLPLSSGLLSRVRINSSYISLNQALASGDAGDLEAVLIGLNGIAAVAPESREAWRGAALADMASGRRDDAATAWANVDGHEEELVAWGMRAERTEDWPAAREWYLIAVSLAPHNGDHSYRLASVSAQLGDARAVDYYQQALSAPERTEFGRSNILTRLGELAKRREQPDWKEVLDYYDAAIQRNEFIIEADYVQSRLSRAEALERLGNFEAALEQYRWLINNRFNLYWAYVHGGRLTWYVEKDAETAIRYFQEAITINPVSKWAYLSWADVNVQSGRSVLAIPLLEKVLTIDPSDETARLQLSRIKGSQAP